MNKTHIIDELLHIECISMNFPYSKSPFRTDV